MNTLSILSPTRSHNSGQVTESTEVRVANSTKTDRYSSSGASAPARVFSKQEKETMSDALFAQGEAAAKCTPNAITELGDKLAFRVSGPQWLNHGLFTVPYVTVADEATAKRIQKMIIDTAAESTGIAGGDSAAIRAFARDQVQVSRTNILASSAGEKLRTDAERLRTALADPRRAPHEAKKAQFAVLDAGFGSGAYGFDGPYAYFRSQQPLTLAEAKKILETDAKSYSSGTNMRIVPASMSSMELTAGRDGFLPGTNSSANEIQLFMQNGGDLRPFTVMQLQSFALRADQWKIGADEKRENWPLNYRVEAGEVGPNSDALVLRPTEQQAQTWESNHRV